MSTCARIAVAKQQITKKIDQRTDHGHYMMTKQVRHESLPATSHLPSRFAASPPQIYSPTSTPLHQKLAPKASRVPSTAETLSPTQQFEAILDASVHNTMSTSRLTPTEHFEQMLNNELEAKTKGKTKRMLRWYRLW